MFLHHHRQFQRVPCFTCYLLYHSSSKCSSTRGNILHDHHRMFAGVLGTSEPVSSLEFSHLDATERLDHVMLLAASLEASTNKLQVAASKSPLLTKVSVSPPDSHPHTSLQLGDHTPPRWQEPRQPPILQPTAGLTPAPIRREKIIAKVPRKSIWTWKTGRVELIVL